LSQIAAHNLDIANDILRSQRPCCSLDCLMSLNEFVMTLEIIGGDRSVKGIVV
jgi:hypothetical protein